MSESTVAVILLITLPLVFGVISQRVEHARARRALLALLGLGSLVFAIIVLYDNVGRAVAVFVAWAVCTIMALAVTTRALRQRLLTPTLATQPRRKVTTTSPLLVYRKRDVCSNATTVSSGRDIQLGAVTLIEGKRKWMQTKWTEATLDDGSVGYVFDLDAERNTTGRSTHDQAPLSELPQPRHSRALLYFVAAFCLAVGGLVWEY